MGTERSSTGSDPLDRLAEEYLARRRRRGELPTPGEYAERYPEHAARILELFPDLELIERLKPAPGDAAGLSADTGRETDPGTPPAAGRGGWVSTRSPARSAVAAWASSLRPSTANSSAAWRSSSWKPALDRLGGRGQQGLDAGARREVVRTLALQEGRLGGRRGIPYLLEQPLASTTVEAVASSSEPSVALRASVRQHRSNLGPIRHSLTWQLMDLTNEAWRSGRLEKGAAIRCSDAYVSSPPGRTSPARAGPPPPPPALGRASTP
jgi:hypothetical protein